MIMAALAAATSQQHQAQPTLVLHSGTHVIDSGPLHLGPEHSGVSITALSDEFPPPSISGGHVVAGPWSLLNASKNLWRATTPVGLPSARQLFVDGRRAHRTKLWWPAGQWDVTGSSLIGGGGASRSLLGLQAGATVLPELVWTGGCKEHAPHCAPGQHSYREARCPVTSITALADGVNVTVVQPCFGNARRLSGCGIPSFLENARGLLTDGGIETVSAGTFFFDAQRRELLYAALAGTNPADSVVVLPVLERLLVIGAGTRDVRLSGIVFEHATWLAPNSPTGFVDDQAGVHFDASGSVPASEMIDGAVVLEAAQRVTVHNCTFRHLGGVALRLRAGSQHNLVSHCLFHDISASAVAVGLEFIHSRGFVHFDIKPANILLNVDGLTGKITNVKIADFGMAVPERRDFKAGKDSVGTMCFMAPEMLQIESTFDKRVDIWSTGVLLH